MAKSKQSSDTRLDPVAMGQAMIQQIEEAGLGSMRWMGTAWFEVMADMNSEVVSFVADRIREDVKTQHALLHCKTAADMQRAQVAFLEKAYTQYTEETGKLIKMGMDMLPDASTTTKNTPV
ncbi:phasin protein [Yoonia maricola]|uniref:Phasin protein n=1 Tax=Yoonia maricola TaxID=420999 RepID=A0A2M8WMC8_9RHOB|nr:phasin family protein [Yoonia maricola]PJI92079.1 phasin protein [Yoonia maricola]